MYDHGSTVLYRNLDLTLLISHVKPGHLYSFFFHLVSSTRHSPLFQRAHAVIRESIIFMAEILFLLVEFCWFVFSLFSLGSEIKKIWLRQSLFLNILKSQHQFAYCILDFSDHIGIPNKMVEKFQDVALNELKEYMERYRFIIN